MLTRMTKTASLLATLILSGCVSPAARVDMPKTDSARGSTLHSFTIDRAYTLTDPRELAFRDQIAAEARVLCGFGDFSLYSSQPVGFEVVREDYLYRQYDVQITCDG